MVYVRKYSTVVQDVHFGVPSPGLIPYVPLNYLYDPTSFIHCFLLVLGT